jgi:hypothetical protein
MVEEAEMDDEGMNDARSSRDLLCAFAGVEVSR